MIRVVYSYGILDGGGCEKRMGDLVRWLLANGDEAWIVGTRINPRGRSQLFDQQGIPRDRIILCEPDGVLYTMPDGFGGFLDRTCRALRADIVDVQYPTTTPTEAPCRMVYTMHGTAQPMPNITFDGVISVEDPVDFGSLLQHGGQHFTAIHNWVDTDRFPFQRQLGDGACFIGRNSKTVNVFKVAQFWDGVIDCYGMDEVPTDDYPDNVRWLGYADPAEVLPKYRVLFGTGQIALEALAAGRFVIAGGHPYIWPPGGTLVRPRNIAALAKTQFCTPERSHDIPAPLAKAVWAEFRRAMRWNAPISRWRMSRYVRKHHDADKQMAKVRKFYEEVLA